MVQDQQDAKIVVADLGAIASLELPEWWVEAPPPQPMGGRQLRKFHPEDQPKVRLCSYVRTVSLSNPASQAFQQAIYSEFHAIQPDEINGLQEVLEAMANPDAFQITDAATGYLSSRRVLKIQGRWLRGREDTICLFVDLHGDGRQVQQIYYIAPAKDFADYRGEVDAIFVSIKWKLES